MALSNWDCLAFDTNGKPCNGILRADNGSSVQIYKNRLHVFDSRWPDEVMAFIDHGDITVSGFTIRAIHIDQQNAMFCFVEYCEYHDAGVRSHYMAGIGCCGFMSNIEWLKQHHSEVIAGIDPQYLDDASTIHSCEPDGKRSWCLAWIDGEDHYHELPLDIPEPDLEALWIGTLPETLSAFREWLNTVAPLEYLDLIDLDQSLRFNQGDEYFHQHAGIQARATKVGQQEPPVIAGSIEETGHVPPS